MGGVDKALLEVADRPLLERALDAVTNAERVVVVGPHRSIDRNVLWAREHPVGGGPVAALAAGLAGVRSEIVVVLAVDMPLVDRAIVQTLVDSIGDHAGAAVVGSSGRIQPLAAVYRKTEIEAAIARLKTPSGAAVHSVVDNLSIRKVRFERADIDCDTPEDVALASALLRERT